MPQILSELAGDWTAPSGVAAMELLNSSWQAMAGDETAPYR
jgi:hypothetical protein